VVNLLIFISGL